VNLIKEQSPDSPKTCHAALLEKIKKQGWHDEIYNSAPLPEVRLGRSLALQQDCRIQPRFFSRGSSCPRSGQIARRLLPPRAAFSLPLVSRSKPARRMRLAKPSPCKM
jgi:hypothetical protein